MFGPPLRGPQLVALDPELAKTTPDSIWLSTGVRAVDHCVETLCSIQNPDATVDEIALTALNHLVPGLLLCKKDRTDGDAYLKCQLGSAETMEACSKGSYVLGASHGIGHQVTPIPSHHHLSLNTDESNSSAHWVSATAKQAVSSYQPCASSTHSTTPTETARPVYATT